MTTTTRSRRKYSEEDIARFHERLCELLPPGATAWTVRRHTSSSGMLRAIDIYAIKDDRPIWLSAMAASFAGFTFSDHYEAITISGAGMDMGFHLVYSLSRALYPDGFGCIGEDCPSNDHVNGDRDYTRHCPDDCAMADGTPHVTHWHKDGGYALRHHWI